MYTVTMAGSNRGTQVMVGMSSTPHSSSTRTRRSMQACRKRHVGAMEQWRPTGTPSAVYTACRMAADPATDPPHMTLAKTARPHGVKVHQGHDRVAESAGLEGLHHDVGSGDVSALAHVVRLGTEGPIHKR